MQVRHLLVILVVLALSSVAQAQFYMPRPGVPLDSIVVNLDVSYDVKYIHMDIEVTPDTEYVAGSVLLRSLAVESPFINRMILTLREQIGIDSIKNEKGTALKFERMGEKVFVSLESPKQPGESFDVRVFYHGYSTIPDRKGFIHTTQYPDGTGDNIIWSSSEPYEAKNWWPCKDNPSDKIDSADLWFTCAEKYKVASNGLLQEVTPLGNGKHTYKWKSSYPIAHYLVAFVCTTFDTFTTYWKYSDVDSLPIQNFVYPGQAATWREKLQVVPDILSTYQQWFGPYPFLKEKYGHAQWRGGGMENQTISFVNYYDTALLAHEAAHQWWGDAITCASWNEIWLNEGFATYYTSRYMGKAQGEQAHLLDMAKKERFITSLPNGSVFVYDSSLANDLRVFDGRTTYDKGAWVLHMLRYVLGDSSFNAVMKGWMMGPHRYGNGTTPEFAQYVEKTTGRDLRKFFGQWVFAEGFPQYQFSPQTAPLFGQWRAVIYLDQTPTGSPVFYEMPIQVRVEGDGWDSLLVLNNTQNAQSWDMMFEKEPKRWIFDPFNNILDGRVEQYLKVESSSPDGVVMLQPNPVKKGGALSLSLMNGYALKSYEIIDTRGVSVMRDSAMHPDLRLSLPIRELSTGAYTIRLSLLNDKGEAIERVEKFVIE
jgi:hypothetical protein